MTVYNPLDNILYHTLSISRCLQNVQKTKHLANRQVEWANRCGSDSFTASVAEWSDQSRDNGASETQNTEHDLSVLLLINTTDTFLKWLFMRAGWCLCCMTMLCPCTLHISRHMLREYERFGAVVQCKHGNSVANINVSYTKCIEAVALSVKQAWHHALYLYKYVYIIIHRRAILVMKYDSRLNYDAL